MRNSNPRFWFSRAHAFSASFRGVSMRYLLVRSITTILLLAACGGADSGSVVTVSAPCVQNTSGQWWAAASVPNYQPDAPIVVTQCEECPGSTSECAVAVVSSASNLSSGDSKTACAGASNCIAWECALGSSPCHSAEIHFAVLE